ncbi:hypothetical protein MMC16_005660 [Acarospora aff. strigata]|nr:hypothetical protein [Acarospora aff. strigata]
MEGLVKNPVWPPKPNLFDEVSWGDLPSTDDYRVAYRVWGLPDVNLAPNGVTQNNDPPSVLVRNVYDHILANRFLRPPDGQAIDPNAQMNVGNVGSVGPQGWSYDQIYPDAAPRPAVLRKEDLEVDGHGWKADKPRIWWNKGRLVEALRRRKLADAGKVADLKDRLFEDERQKRQRAQQHQSDGRLPRASLQGWGIERVRQFILKLERGTTLSPLDMYTWAILLSPYNPTYWTSRAYLFYQLGYFDLALGDAYRAFYLVEILHNVNIRTRQPGLYRCILDALEQHILATGATRDEEPVVTMRKANGVNAFVPPLRRTFHHIISLSLIALEAWDDYLEMDKHLTDRITQAGKHSKPFTQREKSMRRFTTKRKEEVALNITQWNHGKRTGSIVARRYPQAAADVDRTRDAFLAKLNETIINGWPGADEQGPRVQVRTAGSRGLGVNASGKFEEKAMIYAEEPSVRGHLARKRPLATTTCENCKRTLTEDETREIRQRWRGLDAGAKRENQDKSSCACCELDENRVPLYFCSKVPATQKSSDQAEDPESCMEIARGLFHNRACGRQWRWLHDAMQPILGNAEANIPAVDYESHGTHLSLLLREVFDMTLMARRQGTVPNLLAHEIDALLPLCGGEDFVIAPEQRFPFGFAANIIVPFDILLGLGVNVFKDLEFDTWVVQTVLRKLHLNAVPWDLRRRGPTDKIESALKLQDAQDPSDSGVHADFENLYIHTGFSMFNHACPESANARWFWDADEKGIPNRILVQATCEIEDGDEIRLCYFPETKAGRFKKIRLLGRDCDCKSCASTK